MFVCTFSSFGSTTSDQDTLYFLQASTNHFCLFLNMHMVCMGILKEIALALVFVDKIEFDVSSSF